MSEQTPTNDERDRIRLGQSAARGATGDGRTGVPDDEQGISNRPGDTDPVTDDDAALEAQGDEPQQDRQLREGHPSRVNAEAAMPEQKRTEMPVVVPLPSSDTPAEHERVRKSNDRDQQLEREGKVSPHSQGYDEAADGPPTPKVRHVVDEP